jgi:hypothetical protein
MNPKPLSLDFRRAPRSASWARWLLVAAAVAFTADLAWSYRALSAEVARKEARLLASPRHGRTALPAPRIVDDDEVRSARETIRQLGTPWPRLFNAIEAVHASGVALLAIEPNAENGAVIVSGEAKDYPMLLKFVSSLEQSAGLREVQLQKHNVLANDPRKAISFTVSASWRVAP